MFSTATYDFVKHAGCSVWYNNVGCSVWYNNVGCSVWYNNVGCSVWYNNVGCLHKIKFDSTVCSNQLL